MSVLSKQPTRVRTFLVRPKDALVLAGDFRPLLEELDLHILSCELDYDPLSRQLLADGLTALALHIASRPQDECVGWTISIQKPPMNLFFTGDAGAGTVVGRVFLEHVEPRPENIFIAQSKRSFGEPTLSSIAVEGIDIYAMAERYYLQSEQRKARYVHRGTEAALILALPQADVAWLESVSAEEALDLKESDEVKLLSEKEIHFRCGCDREKIAGILVGLYGESPEALFGEEERLEVECPRCAAKLVVSREDYRRALEARSAGN